MDELLNQIDQAAQASLSYLALVGAMCVPDMCAALESSKGETNRQRYAAWFDQWVAPRYTVGPSNRPSLTGADAYALRCSLLHQGRTQNPRGSYSRVIFVEGLAIHNNVTGGALNLEVATFCSDVTGAARQWLRANRNTPTFQKNYPLFMQRYANGVPQLQGVPVIT